MSLVYDRLKKVCAANNFKKETIGRVDQFFKDKPFVVDANNLILPIEFVTTEHYQKDNPTTKSYIPIMSPFKTTNSYNLYITGFAPIPPAPPVVPSQYIAQCDGENGSDVIYVDLPIGNWFPYVRYHTRIQFSGVDLSEDLYPTAA